MAGTLPLTTAVATVQRIFADPSNTELFALAIAVGIAAHLLVFIHGEWHVQGPLVVMGHGIAIIFMAFLLLNNGTFEFASFAQSTAIFLAGYIGALFSSILVYRSTYHRLTRAGFPGPRIAGLTKLWHTWACRKSRNHMVLYELNQKYGDFVRTGPSEITCFHPDVYAIIDGPESYDLAKAEWYDILHPNVALVTCRSKESHKKRRRQWTQGFSVKAVDLYDSKLLKHIDELDEILEQNALEGKPSQMTELFQWFAFDAMGSFIFHKSFGMLKNQGWHHVIISLKKALSILGPLSPTPWIPQLAFKLLPKVWLLKDWFKTIHFCEEQMRERAYDHNEDEPDVAYYLYQDAKSHGFQPSDWMWLSGDSLFAIVAGSDPASSTLTNVFNELAKKPEHAEIIRKEVEGVDVNDPKSLWSLEHLNAVIYEALRLYPALPTGGNRKTDHNGIFIAGTYIPPYTTISAPRYPIVRSKFSYSLKLFSGPSLTLVFTI